MAIFAALFRAVKRPSISRTSPAGEKPRTKEVLQDDPCRQVVLKCPTASGQMHSSSTPYPDRSPSCEYMYESGNGCRKKAGATAPHALSPLLTLLIRLPSTILARLLTTLFVKDSIHDNTIGSLTVKNLTCSFFRSSMKGWGVS